MASPILLENNKEPDDALFDEESQYSVDEAYVIKKAHDEEKHEKDDNNDEKSRSDSKESPRSGKRLPEDEEKEAFDLEEISGNEFERLSPGEIDQKQNKNKENKPKFNFKDSLVIDSGESDYENRPIRIQRTKPFCEKIKEENGDLILEEPKKEEKKMYYDYYNKWWKNSEKENSDNSITIYNIDQEIDEEIIYELFCQVGKIKRIKLFRFSNDDIRGSSYLKTLPKKIFEASRNRPHKRRAIVEYHSSSSVNAAIKVFNGIRLNNRQIYVAGYSWEELEDIPYQIHILRNKYQDEWFDKYFCLDYFSKSSNVVHVQEFPDPSKVEAKRIKIYFPTKSDWLIAKDLLKDKVQNYFSRSTKFFTHFNPRKNVKRNNESSNRSTEEKKNHRDRKKSDSGELSPTPKKMPKVEGKKLGESFNEKMAETV